MSFSNIQADPETKVYTFQPTTSDGQSTGTPVNIEYKTEAELREKLHAATRRMKFVVSSKTITAPENAQRFDGDGPGADQVRKDVAAFLQETPGYHAHPSNKDAIVSWIGQNDLQPNLENFKLAFSTLARAGLLIGPDGRPTSSSDTTGISYTDPRSGKTYHGKKALDAMPADVYKRKLVNEFGFADRVERVLSGK
jgi:hypothetical protein